MSLVLDASASIALLHREIADGELERLVDQIDRSGAVVPQLWHLEVVNVLLINARKGRYDLAAVQEYLASLARMTITVDTETHKRAWAGVRELAGKQRLTSYDAAYLELAARKRLSLATLDRELIRAAQAEKVPLFWN